jgi:hypothetical protein
VMHGLEKSDFAHVSDEGPVMGLERRGCVVQPWPRANW